MLSSFFFASVVSRGILGKSTQDSKMLKVKTDSQGYNAAVVACDVLANTVISVISGTEISKEPSKYTIHTDINEHTVIPDELRYTNHVCRTPNSRFDFSSKPWKLVSTREIKAGDWLSYDYVTTEYVSGAEFDCKCGGPECRGRMDGFRFLSDEEKSEMIKEKKVSPVIETLHKRDSVK